MKNNDLVFESCDNYKINIPSSYVLINNNKLEKENIFLEDIGIHSRGFVKVISFATILAIVIIFSLYFLFRI